MIQTEPSMLSLITAAFYCLVAFACLLTMASASFRRQSHWHVHSWSALALLFAVLAAMRVFAIEDLLREELRLVLQAEGLYEDRRVLQGPVFAALFITSAAIGGLWTFHVSRTIRGRRNIAAMIAIASGCTLVFLLTLRILSLHSVDQLLYGPLKLNWIIDLGASATVLASGFIYWRIVTGRMR